MHRKPRVSCFLRVTCSCINHSNMCSLGHTELLHVTNATVDGYYKAASIHMEDLILFTTEWLVCEQ